MSSEIVVLVFDIIILILGINTLLSALRMKKNRNPVRNFNSQGRAGKNQKPEGFL